MLHTLKPARGSRRPRKRMARGNSAGLGTTAGRGTKGQHARTGKGRRLGFEGGQTPLLRRQPKLGGFTRPRRVTYEVLNTSALVDLPAGEYDLAALKARKIVRSSRPVKLLSGLPLKSKLSLEVHASSKSAKKMVEDAGGKLIMLPIER